MIPTTVSRFLLIVVGSSLYNVLEVQAVDFHPPQPYVTETLYQQVKTACPTKAWACVEEQLFKLIPTYGPRGAIDTFVMMRDHGEIDPAIDAHHFVHHVGHHTAMAFGSNSQAFALCPTVVHYGCFHDFFQHALGMGGTTAEAATHIFQEL